MANLIENIRADDSLIPDSTDDADKIRPWIALQRLFHRIWWFRVWIIQEATCDNETIFHCGTSKMSWNDLKDACSTLMNTGSSVVRTHVLESEGFARFMRMVVFHDQRRTCKDELDFMSVLSAFRTAEATDDKDKVYAAVGLMTVSMQKHITVDYDDPVTKVYTDAALAFIKATSTLDILAHCEVEIGIPGLPSWVPDWSIWTGIKVLTYHFDQNMHSKELDCGTYNPLYRSTKGSRASTEFFPGPPTLVLKRAILDKIAHTSPPYPDLNDPPTALPAQAWRSFAANLLPSATYRNGEPMDTAIRRTFVADKKAGFLGAAKQRDFALIWPEHADQEPQDVQRDVATSVSVATFQRRFAVSELGYVGLVPRVTAVGDEICILEGGQTPFVLRQDINAEVSEHDTSWKFIGEAYIHGVMDGEAWPPEKLRTFSIR